MNLVDIAILILKLIVAALQLPEVIQIQVAPKGSGKPLPFYI